MGFLTRTIRRLDESAFSANIGFAITYALFAYDSVSRLPVNASANSGRLLEAFSRMLFHLAPLVVHMRTKADLLRSVLVREGLFIAVMFVTATLIYWVVRLSTSRAAERSYFNTLAGASALVAVPFCWLYIVHATWLISFHEPRTFWDACGIRSALELSAAVGIALRCEESVNLVWRGPCGTALCLVGLCDLSVG